MSRADDIAYERSMHGPICDAVGLGDAYAFLAAHDDSASRLSAGVLGAVAHYLLESGYRIERAA